MLKLRFLIRLKFANVYKALRMPDVQIGASCIPPQIISQIIIKHKVNFHLLLFVHFVVSALNQPSEKKSVVCCAVWGRLYSFFKATGTK